MSTATEMLAREMVHLDQAIQIAAREHNWIEASELEDARERVQATRSTMLRRDVHSRAALGHGQGG